MLLVPGRCLCRACWPSCLAFSPFARASKVSTSRSSRRRMTFATMLLFFRNNDRLWRQQRLHRLQAHPGLHRSLRRSTQARRSIWITLAGADRRRCSAARMPWCANPSWDGCSRRFATPRAVSCSSATIQLWFKLFIWTLVGHVVCRGRCALRAASRHHQPGRDVDTPTRSRW